MKGFKLINSKGISILFLLIAMLLMVTIGYVFSYLIPTKQKSLSLAIHSTQAFYIAQSGVEFAVRFATENNWTTPALLLSNLNSPPNNTRNLGPGRFILTYSNTPPNLDTLSSIGEVPIGTERRRISVSNFTSFLAQQGLILWIEPPAYPAPCWFGGGNRRIRFFIKNTGGSSITLNRFSASWSTPPNNRAINRIVIGTNVVFLGTYAYPNCDPCIRNFGNTQTVNANQVLSVLITWNLNIGGQLPVVVTFYDISGNPYPMTLQPAASCP